MSFAQCDGAWRSDDFTRCFRQDYLQTLFPLIACGASVLYLTIQVIVAARQSRLQTAYDILKNEQPNGRTGHEEDSDSEEDEMDVNEDLALMATKSVADASVVDFDRPRGELLIPLVEEVCVLAVLGIQIALLVEQWDRKGRVAAIA